MLVDRGLFQGLKQLRLRNREDPCFDPGFLDHIVVTHAHIDHTGYLPRLTHYRYRGPVHCTPATAELLEIMRWIGSARRLPRRIFEVHGEPEGSQQLAGRIGRELGMDVVIPQLEESYPI